MNHLMELVHPGKEHFLYFLEGNRTIYKEGSFVPLSETCQKCKQPVSRDCYKCKRNGKGCEYYIHKECVELKDLPQEHHPLHPQHPLARIENNNFPYFKSFICSFCRETYRWDEISVQCSDDQCDFALHDSCASNFLDKPELLDKYEIDQHFLHNHENHRLSPYGFSEEETGKINPVFFYELPWNIKCAGCKDNILNREAVFKCTGCNFSLHVECSQVPEEVVNHNSHPQHPLVLLRASESDDQEDEEEEGDSNSKLQQLRCIACLKWMENEFYLHCTHCPTFNHDLQCYFRFQTKPTVKHEAHEHPLAYFSQIYDDDASCYACNASCKDHLFRCFTCNFNIHPHCLSLPITVNHDEHVHPLTLTSSFMDEHPASYYCDICEKRRDPDHGIYLCKECPFIAHFECALSLSTAEEKAHAHVPWRQNLSDEVDVEDMTLTNKKACVEILDHLNNEIEKVRQVLEELFIKKEEGEQLTEKLQEFEEIHANTEDMLRRLKQSVREINSN